MIINEHELVHAEDAGNGYHGRCKHCGTPLVTDLGYCSWEGVKCVNRKVEELKDIPQIVKNYANYRGYKWDYKNKIFTKPSFSETLDHLTIDQMYDNLTRAQIQDIFYEKNNERRIRKKNERKL